MPYPLNDDLNVNDEQNASAASQDATDESPEMNEHSPEQLKQAALKQLEELRTPRKDLIEMQSNLELIMKRHGFDQSFLDIAAQWYNETAWWYQKAGIALLLTSAGALTGLITGVILAPVFGLLAIGLYFACTFLLTEHYNTTTRREARLRTHFSERENAMTDALDLLTTAENQVEEILTTLCELNVKSADNLSLFESQVGDLNTQTTRYLDTIRQLEQTTASIVRDNEVIGQNLTTAGAELNESSQDMDSQPRVLKKLASSLQVNSTALLDANDDFTAVSKKMRTHVACFGQLVEGFQEQLTVLSQRVMSQEALKDTTKTNTDGALDTSVSIDQLMQDSNEALLGAEAALAAFEAYQRESLVQKDVAAPAQSLMPTSCFG